MSLPTSDLSFFSSKIADAFTGLQLVAVVGECCSLYGVEADYRLQGRTEAKAKFVHRVLGIFGTDFQITLIRYFVDKSSRLQDDKIVQQALVRLSRDYDNDGLSDEELEKRSELERLLEPYTDVLRLWQKVEIFRTSYQYQDSLNNLRLALEVLLKRLLGNSKSIENQQQDFCQKLGESGLPNELVNSIWKSVADDKLFQNNKVTDLEVKFIVNKTIPLMIYLIQKLG